MRRGARRALLLCLPAALLAPAALAGDADGGGAPDGTAEWLRALSGADRAAVSAALRAQQAHPPLPEALGEGADPYAWGLSEADLDRAATMVCGVTLASDGENSGGSSGGGSGVDECTVTYSLANFSSADEALRHGASVTHLGACGVCSGLDDLAVYVGSPDLVDGPRNCALRDLAGGWEAGVACLADIGFSERCAWVWLHNARNTREHCLQECLQAMQQGLPNNMPDGSLNPCLQCDEDESGAVFKAVAGRTRRNSGLQSGITRGDEEIADVSHDYWRACVPSEALSASKAKKKKKKKKKRKKEKEAKKAKKKCAAAGKKKRCKKQKGCAYDSKNRCRPAKKQK